MSEKMVVNRSIKKNNNSRYNCPHAETINILFLRGGRAFCKGGWTGDVGKRTARALRKLPRRYWATPFWMRGWYCPHHSVIKPNPTVGNFSSRKTRKRRTSAGSEAMLDGLPIYLIGGEPITSVGSVYSSIPWSTQRNTRSFPGGAGIASCLELESGCNPCNDWHTALAIYGLLLKRWAARWRGQFQC